MSITTTARRTVLASAACLTVIAGLAGAADAHNAAQPNGFVYVETCTSLTGTVSITPGLKPKAHSETAVVSGTLDGCSSFGSPQPGQGSFTAVVSGTASTTAGTLTGTFTANWPASSGLNPSNGTITITTISKGMYGISGTVTSGAWLQNTLSAGYVVTGTSGKGTKHNPIVSQSFVNTQSLQLGHNGG
jgi:hypothetical protein